MMPIGQFGVKIQNHISSNSLQPWEQSEDKGSWATSCVCFSAFLYNSTTKHLFKHFCLTLTYDCEGPRLLTTGWIIGFPGEEVSYSCYVKKKNYFPMKLWNMINLQTMTFVSAVKYERYIGRFNGHQCWKVEKNTWIWNSYYENMLKGKSGSWYFECSGEKGGFVEEVRGPLGH